MEALEDTRVTPTPGSVLVLLEVCVEREARLPLLLPATLLAPELLLGC